MGDLLPNEGTYFAPTEPEEQRQERQQEEAQAKAAEPMIKTLIAYFTDELQTLESVASIPQSVRTKPSEFMHTVAGNEKAADVIRRQLDYLESLLKQ